MVDRARDNNLSARKKLVVFCPRRQRQGKRPAVALGSAPAQRSGQPPTDQALASVDCSGGMANRIARETRRVASTELLPRRRRRCLADRGQARAANISQEGHNTGQEAVGLLSSDQGLVSSSDPGVAATKPLVQAYSTDSRRFFCDFGKSMVENFTRDGGFEIKNGCSGA
ncbi:hypothetical protein GUJ93_ZPchr0002g25540 [Zizania palustris]|uniref:Uncharacterized protein n=1 Tax=Zizania palustris TaxID=103762 RepID=A0A8J5S2S6_ZIZPA|nr:hypothetical protein GUJ93_ZPchr0002g25540 [Zizania palustris]